MPTRFNCLDSGAVLIQAKLATLNPGEGGRGAPSQPGWPHAPGTALFAGGLLAASCQKQGEGRESFQC